MQLLIRLPFGLSTRSRRKAEQHISPAETILLAQISVAGLALPLTYSVMDWLSFADYTLPTWLGWAGVFLLACGLLLFWRAHKDLKANWSPSLELYEGHTLITNGIYRVIRHPMYTSQFLFSPAQLLLIQNWIAGPASLVFFVPFYILRSRAEERMMLAKFGDIYRRYQESTGGLIPKL